MAYDSIKHNSERESFTIKLSTIEYDDLPETAVCLDLEHFPAVGLEIVTHGQRGIRYKGSLRGF